MMAEDYASMRDYPLKKFLPEWTKHGRDVALRRNEVIGLQANACVCFWDGGNSGNSHMIQVANNDFLKLYIIQFT
jgi:hypothetical protein